MALCNEHKKDEYHDDDDCIVCEKDRAIKCCQARKEQLLKKVKQLEEAIWSTKCELMDMHLGEVLDVPIDILQRALESKDE